MPGKIAIGRSLVLAPVLALVLSSVGIGPAAAAQDGSAQDASARTLADMTMCHPTAIEKSAPDTVARLRTRYEKDRLFEPYEDDYPTLLDTVMEGIAAKMREVMQRHRDGCVRSVGEVFDKEMSPGQIDAAIAYLQTESGRLQQDYILEELLYGEIIRQAERVFLRELTQEEAIEAYELNLVLASYAIYRDVGPEKGAPMVAFAQSPDGRAFTRAMGEAVEPWRQWTGRLIGTYTADLARAGQTAGRTMICNDPDAKLSPQGRRELCGFSRR